MVAAGLDIVLHIGAHRCGTTTLQHMAHLNRADLNKAGVAVWTPTETRHSYFSDLLYRPDAVTPMIARRCHRAHGLIDIALDRLARDGARTLLISDEEMIGSNLCNLRFGMLYGDLMARLARFASRIGPRCRRIGLSVRSYDTFWASTLGFGVGQGQPMPTRTDLDALVAMPRRWRHVVEDVAHAFPQADVVVWPFERFVSQPDVALAHLLDVPEIGANFVGRTAWHNASPRRDKLRRLLSLRGEARISRTVNPGDGRWMPFDRVQQGDLRRAYAEDIDWLRRGAGGLARFVEAPLTTAVGPSVAPDVVLGETLLRTPRRQDWSEPSRFEITAANGVGAALMPPAEAREHERVRGMV